MVQSNTRHGHPVFGRTIQATILTGLQTGSGIFAARKTLSLIPRT
jgi:hypothetical protein